MERLIPAASRGRHRQHHGKAPWVRPMGQGLELLASRGDGTTIALEIGLSPERLASRREARGDAERW